MKESMKVFMQGFLKDVAEEGRTREEKSVLNTIPVTEKSYDELTESERETVIQKLLSERQYYVKDGVHIAYGREKSLQQAVFLEEFNDCKVLVSLGFEVYLLPNGCAAKDGQFKEFADAVVDGRLLELKNIETEKMIGKRFGEARHQGQDVYISIKTDVGIKTALREVFKKIGNIKKNGNQKDLSGRLFLHFETQQKTYMYTIDKYGAVKERPL